MTIVLLFLLLYKDLIHSLVLTQQACDGDDILVKKGVSRDMDQGGYGAREEAAQMEFEELIRRLCLLVFLLDAGKVARREEGSMGFGWWWEKKEDVLT